MNIHQEILAKSEQNGHVCLYQHLKNVPVGGINLS